MCTCLEDFKKEFKKQYPTWNNRPVKDVSLPEGFSFKTGDTFYYVPIYINVGYQKPKESSLLIRFCPVCGKPMPGVEPWKPEEDKATSTINP